MTGATTGPGKQRRISVKVEARFVIQGLEFGSERFNDQSAEDHLDLGYVSGVRLGFLFRTGLYL